MGQAFGGSGFGRANHQRNMRILVVVGFILMSCLAIGVPLLSKPAMVAPAAVPSPIPLVDVFLPLQRISVGTMLTPVMFKKESMSPVSVAALGGQPVKSEAELVGKYARVLVMPGRPLMADQLMDAPDNVITRKIRPGFRAVTVQVNNVSGIEGWGLPGTRVDVLWVTDSVEDDKVVTTIVKPAQILSVSGKTDVLPPNQAPLAPALAKGLPVPQAVPPPDRGFTVTLLVTPDDGQKIFLATRSGELSLMLRGDFDGNQEATTQQNFTTKRLLQGGADSKGQVERVEGVAKSRRPDGSTEEWSVIEGRVWRWDQGQGSTWAQ